MAQWSGGPWQPLESSASRADSASEKMWVTVFRRVCSETAKHRTCWREKRDISLMKPGLQITVSLTSVWRQIPSSCFFLFSISKFLSVPGVTVCLLYSMNSIVSHVYLIWKLICIKVLFTTYNEYLYCRYCYHLEYYSVYLSVSWWFSTQIRIKMWFTFFHMFRKTFRKTTGRL